MSKAPFLDGLSSETFFFEVNYSPLLGLEAHLSH